jgi:small subunit ribosomal protein S1
MNHESFAELFQESLIQTDLRPGAVVRATIIRIDPDYVIVNAGLKSDSIIPISEFKNENGEVEVNLGDEVDVIVELVEDGFGETRLSREKAKRSEAWITLEKAYRANQIVTGIIIERVKGGFTVDLNTVRAFLPGSLADTRPVRDPGSLEGKALEFKLIKLDRKRNNVVVSRKAAIEAEASDRSVVLDTLVEGQELTGIVKNITDYGAFVDLGGIDGLLHITDLSWKRVKHPKEILKVGEEIQVKVLKFDREKKRVSLGLKQMGEDPWSNLARRYPVGARLIGRITNITDYGCFVEIENGIEGLVHMSELDWTNKNIHPSKVVQLGQEVEVMVLDIDEERRRISLGIKQCATNPWKDFEVGHEKSQRVKGKIRSITDFGIFVGLEGNIDGLIHLSDISWNETGEQAIRNYKKGDEIEAVILSIDAARERISLGIKQMEGDPFGEYVDANPRGTVVNGKIVKLEPKAAVVDLGSGIQGQLRASEIGRDIQDIGEHFKIDDEIQAKIVGADRKNRLINLSLKALHETLPNDEADDEKSGTLGDLLKEQIENKE